MERLVGRFPPRQAPLRIVIPGGSGQVGRILARHFYAAGDHVVVLARSPAVELWRTVAWNGAEPGPWQQELNGADIVINLAGRSVNCRYSARNRREIIDSRVKTTRLIADTIAQCARPPAIWFNASTATIYRHALDRPMDEITGELGGHELNIPSSWRFSIEVATQWENAFFEKPAPQTRKVAMRSAMIMSPDRGGVFDTLHSLVRLGLGGHAGAGDQWISWIHEADFIGALEFLIARGELDGAVNISSPNPLPNRAFMRELRRASHVLAGLPASRWMLELGAFFLRTETELILKSRRVTPARLLHAGFTFQFPDWAGAARELCAPKRR